jgi:hypothetical protein
MRNQISIKNFFLLALIVVSDFSLYAFSQTYTYVVKSEYDINDPVHLKGTYKGNVIDLSYGIAFLQESERVNSFELIITAEHPKMSTGEIPHLERIPEVPCDWYDISWTTEGTKIVWSIKKRPEESLPPRIPNNALIICYPPEFVEKIESKNPQESSISVIHLPTLILKKNLSPEEKEKRDATLTRSILAHLDVSSSFSPATQLVKQGNKVKLARGY